MTDANEKIVTKPVQETWNSEKSHHPKTQGPSSLGLPWWFRRIESAGSQKTQVWSLDEKDPLEKGMATHSRFLPWRIPWTEEPGRL